MTTTTLKRLAVARQTSFADLDCSIQGTSIRKNRPRALFSAAHVVFLIKATMPSQRTWQFQCTLHDVGSLHRNLVKAIDDETFQADLATLVCPKQPLFQRTNTLVVKSMCCDLEYYLTSLLKLCQSFVVTGAPCAVDIEATMRSFFDVSSAKARAKAALTN